MHSVVANNCKRASPEDRFWRNVSKSESGCWNWTASVDRSGHGQFGLNGKLMLVHRFSFALHNGVIPEGKIIRHKCDNRRCVNPDHLVAGTIWENNQDRVIRRHVVGPGRKSLWVCEGCGPYVLRIRATPEQRFWKKVRKTDTCWVWTGRLQPDGYAKIYANGKSLPAHRFSYQIHFGSVPSGLVVRHACDNRRCVNPGHLQVGTQKDNIQDGIRRGRIKPWNKGVRGYRRGKEREFLEAFKNAK